MTNKIRSAWTKSLLLLAVTASRREAVIALVQTALLSPSSSSSSSSHRRIQSANSLYFINHNHNEIDVATAPLSQLINLQQEDSKAKTTTTSATAPIKNYQLVSPTDDVIPLLDGQRLICIGDVHGDYEALKEFLSIGGVFCSRTGDWIGGNTILVQCGDVLDRGSEELLCFQLLTRLSQQAANDGGSVILLWGNHEALNAGGMFHYTTGEEEYERTLGRVIDHQLHTDKWRMQYAGNQPARWAAYEPGSGLLAHPLLSNMKVAVKVGRTVCVHAGLTAKHLDDYGGLQGMNREAQRWMKEASDCTNNNLGNYDSMEALVADVRKRAQAGSAKMPEVLGGGAGADSPVWMRDYSNPSDAPPKNPKAQQMIDAVLFHLQADRMVMGHTVQRQINAALNGKAWRVDVGASKGVMHGTPEVLEVVKLEDGTEEVSILTRHGKVAGDQRRIGASVATAIAAYFR